MIDERRMRLLISVAKWVKLLLLELEAKENMSGELQFLKRLEEIEPHG